MAPDICCIVSTRSQKQHMGMFAEGGRAMQRSQSLGNTLCKKEAHIHIIGNSKQDKFKLAKLATSLSGSCLQGRTGLHRLTQSKKCAHRIRKYGIGEGLPRDAIRLANGTYTAQLCEKLLGSTQVVHANLDWKAAKPERSPQHVLGRCEGLRKPWLPWRTHSTF